MFKTSFHNWNMYSLHNLREQKRNIIILFNEINTDNLLRRKHLFYKLTSVLSNCTVDGHKKCVHKFASICRERLFEM